MNKGLPIVISAPSGCGKDTILEQLYKKNSNLTQSVSATTRAMREGEIDGVSYHFMTTDAFEKMIENGEVLEYTQYCGNYYGTHKKAVTDMLEQGRDVILKIEVEGAMNIKKIFPECVLIFILPPSMSELERRLSLRKRWPRRRSRRWNPLQRKSRPLWRGFPPSASRRKRYRYRS